MIRLGASFLRASQYAFPRRPCSPICYETKGGPRPAGRVSRLPDEQYLAARASIIETIADFRKGEIEPRTEAHVDEWAEQFDAEIRSGLLHELASVLGSTYLSRSHIDAFLDRHLAMLAKISDKGPALFQEFNFLDIQTKGDSQSHLLTVLDERLQELFNFSLNDCGSDCGMNVYLDDILFSGNTVQNDLKRWLQDDAPDAASVQVWLAHGHSLGLYFMESGVREAMEVEDRGLTLQAPLVGQRSKNNASRSRESDVLWPRSSPASAEDFLSTQSKEPRLRAGDNKSARFEGEASRSLLEGQFLEAGLMMWGACESPRKMMRPLGYGPFGFGFGAVIATYRNCPNNAPLALWWGGPFDEGPPLRKLATAVAEAGE